MDEGGLFAGFVARAVDARGRDAGRYVAAVRGCVVGEGLCEEFVGEGVEG